MKVLSLTSTLLAALSVTALAQPDPALISRISMKEKQLAEIQKELTELRNQLNRRVSTGSYTVKTGDTVHSIARRHQISANDLMVWNNISDPTKLGIGEKLVVSGSRKSSTVKTNGYTVSRGDTFYSIARRHNLSVSKLRSLNPDVSTHLISPGQVLQVTGTPVATVEKAVNKPITITQKSQKPEIRKIADKPAPKKTSTATTLAKKPTDPAPKREAVAVVKKNEKVAVSTPPAPPVVEEKRPTTNSTVSSIILTDETTFDAFASKHGTSTDQLNALNGWNLPKATVLARGSEIFVPQ